MTPRLTGRTRLRAGGWFNRKLVLQVETITEIATALPPKFDYRDAQTEDLAELQRMELSMAQRPVYFLRQPENDLPEVPPSARKHH